MSVPRYRTMPRMLRALGLLVAGGLGCGGDGGGPTGVLVVSQVQIASGNSIVLISGTLQLQATPRTSTGIPVPGKTVSWSSRNTGVATVDAAGLVRGITAGTVVVTASVDGVTGEITLEVRPVPVATVEVTADATTIQAGTTTTVHAVARDSVNGVLAGRSVVWSSSNPSVATVSQAGVVSGVTAGTATIVATIEGRTGSVPIQVSALPASRLAFLTPPSAATAGQPISPAIRVAFQNEAGEIAPDATGTITLALAANPAGGTLSGTLSAAASDGIATFANIQLNRAGQGYSLQATAPGFSAIVSDPFSVAAGPAAALAIVMAPAGSAASGDPLGQQPVIQLRDAHGNDRAQAGVSVTAVIASGPGVLGGTTAVLTNAAGRAVFTNLSLVGAVGIYTLRFEAAGLTPVTSGPIGLGAGGATQLTFTTAPPATAINGIPLPSAVRVQLRDGTGNPVAQPGTAVTALLSGGTGTLTGTVVQVTGADGSATFSDLTITGIVGSFTLTFSAPGVTAAVSNPVAITPGQETAIIFTTAPGATATNGTILPVAPVVQLRDLSGNAVAKAGVTIEVGLQSVVLGVLQGTVSRTTNAQGQATFDNLAILGQVGQYVLAFRSGTLTEALSNPITLLPSAAAALAFSTFPPLGTESGVPLAPQPAVQIVDQSGNAVAQAGLTIAAALASGAGALSGTLTALSNAAGTAAFTNLTLTGPAGAHTIRFSGGGFPDLLSPTITVGAGSPTQVTFTTAPPATTVNAAVLAPAVVVQLRDGVGNPSPIAGVTVTATRVSGTGTLGGTLTVNTAADGSATFADLTLTGVAGDYVLAFTVAGLTPATSGPIALQPGPATQLTFTTAPPATAVNGVDIAPAIVAQLRDLSGNAVPTAGVSVAASILSGAGGLLSGTTPVTTAANGSATFSNLRITGSVGSYTLRFAAAGVTPADANPLTLQPGAATALAILTQPPPSAVSGEVLTVAPAVRLVDQSGNTVPTTGTMITAALDAGPGSLGGTLSVATTNGVATFSDLVITGGTGTYTIGFSSAGLTGVISSSIGLGAGAATALQFVGTPPTTATNGVAITPAIAVRLVDASNNPVAQSGVSVTAVLASGPGSLGGTTSMNTDGTGSASFSNLVLTGTTGNYTIRFEVSGITAVTTDPITLSAGAATQLVLTTQPPASATNGATLAPAPVVQLRDQSGNPVTTTGTAITAAILTGAGGTLGGTLIESTVTGSATFDDLAITGAVGNYTLRFTSGALTPATAAAPLSLTAGPATQLGFAVAPPSSATSGAALSPQPQVQVRDQSGNPVSQSGLLITATVSGSAGVTNATATTGAGGLAVFSGLTITGTAGGYTLTFAAAGFPDLMSGTITLGAGAATQLAFITAPPGAATNGSPLSPQPVVELRDASDNPVTQSGVTISAALQSGPGSLLGTLSATTAANGRATFANLELRGTPGDYILRFSSAGLSNRDSDPITLAVGPAAQLLFQTAPPTTAVNGTVFSNSTVIRLADVAGNLVATSGVTVTGAISAGAGAALGGTTSRSTASGLATFDDLTLTGLVGNYELTFSSGGLTSATSNPIELQPGAATQLALTSPVPATGSSGAPLSPAPVVQLRDANGNNVPQSGVTITASIVSPSGNGAVLGGASVATDGTGQATFSALTITGPPDDYSLRFESPTLSIVAPTVVALSAGAPTKLGFFTVPSATAVNGQALAQQPVLQLLDASDNPVAESGRDVAVSLNGGGTLNGGALIVATDGDGRATFAGLTISGLIGAARQLAFSTAGLTGVTSTDITLLVGTATQLAMVTQPPASAIEEEDLATTPVVRLLDAGGNPVDSTGVNITVALTPAGATLDGTTTQATGAGGTASFPGLSLSGTAGSYTLNFTGTDLAAAQSSAIALAVPVAVVVVQHPPDSSLNDIIWTPQPVVRVDDSGATPMVGVSVTVELVTVSGSGTLVGTLSQVTAVGGEASWTDLKIQGVGQFRLRFQTANGTEVLSDEFDVS